LLRAVFATARQRGLIDAQPVGAIDSTGFEIRHASLHYINKRPNTLRFRSPFWAKLTIVCHTKSYLWLGCHISYGPSNDAPGFTPTLQRAAKFVRWDRILADAAYDSEWHHRLSREVLGIRSSVIPINSRGTRKWPLSKYRRQMKRRFCSQVYRQRVHVESSFSMDKRQLGSFLRSRKESSRFQEVLLRVLVHNLAILLWMRGFLQS
jgi:hypothetical protein